MADPQQLIQQLQALCDSPPKDAATQKTLLNLLREASFAVERPIDTVHRLAFAPIQCSVARVAADLKLFDILAATEGQITLQQLADKTGADTLLLRRILRFLTLNGLAREPSPEHYAPTDCTRSLAMPGMQAGIIMVHDVQQPAYAALPTFLAQTNYTNPTDVTNCAFSLAHHTNLPAFGWAADKPAVLIGINEWMSAYRTMSPSFLDAFPHSRLLTPITDSNKNVPLFVDIGGGIGHQCHELITRLPQIRRPIVLEDLAAAITHALPTPGVENRVYDFFTPQPIKGASFYYLKSVLHDWPDDRCIEILSNQRDAMGEESVILIDEIVLPEMGGHWRASEMDIALMACMASVERTEVQWSELLGKVGLRVEEKWTYDDQMLYAIMVVVKK